MITAIGLGNTGTKIVKKLEQYEQYNILSINSGKEIKEYSSPEEYESKCPSFKKIFKNIDNDVYLFLAASGNISGAALRILEQLQGKNLNVVCISSDTITLSSMGNLQQNLVVGVLQEYARSGLLQNLYLLDNSKIEDMLTDVSLENYWDEINSVISYIFHTFLYFQHTPSIMQFGNIDNGLANIHTYGLLDKNNNKTMFYNFKYWTNETYYFSYNKKKDKNFLKNIKQFVQENSKDKKIGTQIFETEDENVVTYVKFSTQIPHTEKTDFGSLDKTSDL